MSEYIIDDRIFKTHFTCDLIKCKGACCTLKGAGGAPILDKEVSEIEFSMNSAKKYLSEKHVGLIDSGGFLEGRRGNYSLMSVNDEDCIFSFNENGIVKCSFEKAYFNKESAFRKPISCHLFPIRIKGKKRNILKYEEIDECKDALVKGSQTKTSIFEFSKDSIIREFGKKFYDHFSAVAADEKHTS